MNKAEAADQVLEGYKGCGSKLAEYLAAQGLSCDREAIMKDTIYGKPRMQEDVAYYVFADGSALNEDFEQPVDNVEDAESDRADAAWEQHYEMFHSG